MASVQGNLNVESVIVEIRAAEGGADARDLCLEQLRIYEKLAARHCL
jgi:protein subunit release factor A